MYTTVGNSYLFFVLYREVIIHFSFSCVVNLLGTCIATISILKFPYSVFSIVMDACIFSKLSSFVAGYNDTLLFAQIVVPAPSGVLCMDGFF